MATEAPLPGAVPLLVIPCLDEAEHIAGLLRQLRRTLDRIGGRIVVADGGSTDGTREIVAQAAGADPRILLVDNPRRIQSAGINLAVEVAGAEATHLVRIDAHCRYPDDYCERLLAEMGRSGADSVVVRMIAEGAGGIQVLTAAIQNAPLGNGGSRHRMRGGGRFVDHGHHALVSLAAFRAVGGYDAAFSHNEDAEFDLRLRQAGFRIWLAADPVIAYYPRRALAPLARQYFNHGRGRARTLLKHAELPRLRQTVVMIVLPALAMVPLGPIHAAFALPAAFWTCACIGAGVALGLRQRSAWLALSGIPAMVMHAAWSAGFWRQIAAGSAAPGQCLEAAR